jgi:hypothetical protein
MSTSCEKQPLRDHINHQKLGTELSTYQNVERSKR